jgi:hypothetical protein
MRHSLALSFAAALAVTALLVVGCGKKECSPQAQSDCTTSTPTNFLGPSSAR